MTVLECHNRILSGNNMSLLENNMTLFGNQRFAGPKKQTAVLK
jgi:hypothetical protein